MKRTSASVAKLIATATLAAIFGVALTVGQAVAAIGTSI